MSDLTKYAPFRPRTARVVAWSLVGLIVVGLLTLLALSLTGYLPAWHAADQIMTLLFFGAGIWIIVRLALVEAVPSVAGLKVRNFLNTRRLEWAEIVNVSFTRNRPWAELDLADGTTLSVMAIQSAEGERGVAEARRLLALIREHEARE